MSNLPDNSLSAHRESGRLTIVRFLEHRYILLRASPPLLRSLAILPRLPARLRMRILHVRVNSQSRIILIAPFADVQRQSSERFCISVFLYGRTRVPGGGDGPVDDALRTFTGVIDIIDPDTPRHPTRLEGVPNNRYIPRL